MHPLGKSPVITDGDDTIAESGAIVDYIVRTYGKASCAGARHAEHEATTSGCTMPRARRCCR